MCIVALLYNYMYMYMYVYMHVHGAMCYPNEVILKVTFVVTDMTHILACQY